MDRPRNPKVIRTWITNRLVKLKARAKAPAPLPKPYGALSTTSVFQGKSGRTTPDMPPV
jgi:hypothetical protein